MTLPAPDTEGPRHTPNAGATAGERSTGRTGHPVVDGVLDTITVGAHRPLAERAEALAAAHEQLHAVLDEHRRPGSVGS